MRSQPEVKMMALMVIVMPSVVVPDGTVLRWTVTDG
jgi:hypothetical protein